MQYIHEQPKMKMIRQKRSRLEENAQRSNNQQGKKRMSEGGTKD